MSVYEACDVGRVETDDHGSTDEALTFSNESQESQEVREGGAADILSKQEADLHIDHFSTPSLHQYKMLNPSQSAISPPMAALL